MDTLFSKGTPPQAQAPAMGLTIEAVQLVAVNARQGWAHCLVEGSSRVVRQVPLPVVSLNRDGSGLFVVPHEGARAFLFYPSRGQPRLLGFRAEGPVAQLAAHWPPLGPGDMVYQSPGGALFAVRDRGIIEARATAGLEWAMVPASNRYRLRAENLDLLVLGGQMRAGHDRETGQTHWRHTVQANAAEDTVVEHSQGHHDTGRRWVLDIDNGSYREEIGQTDDGVVHLHVTGQAPHDRTWSFDQVIGPQGPELYQQTVTGPQGPLWQMSVDRQGLTTMKFNDGKTTLTIDSEGKLSMTTDLIHLGEDGAREPAVLGHAWKAYHDGFMAALMQHQHIGNLGAPSGPVIAPIAGMTDEQLSDVVYLRGRS